MLTGVSIGFQPIKSEPISGGGYRFTKWELLEVSIIAVPCNPAALITQRSYGAARNKALGLDDEESAVALLEALDQIEDFRARAAWPSDRAKAVLERAAHHVDRATQTAKAFGAADVLKRLNEIAKCVVEAADRHDQAFEHLTKLRENLTEARTPDGGVEDPNDDDSIQELAARRARRKAVAELGRRLEAVDAGLVRIARNTPAPPKTLRKIDPARQVELVGTDERFFSGSDRVLVDGLDLADFQNAIWLGHDKNRVVARAIGLEKREGRLYLKAQFPRARFEPNADAAFAAVKRGELRRASLSYAAIELAGDVVTRSTLYEISLCEAGENEGAKVLSIDGEPVGRNARAHLDALRRAVATAPSGAHFTAAWREMEQVRLRANWLN